MRIGMVTSWAVKCGIASYSERLAKALADLDNEVYIARIPRFGNLYNEIVGNIVEALPDVDVLHCQHEYGIYKNTNTVLYRALKGRGVPIVTTMHAIGNWEVDGIIAKNSDTVITHNEFCSTRFTYPNVLIPHGCAPTTCKDKKYSKKALNVPEEAKIVGYIGYISHYKGIETLIDGVERVKSVALIIIGGGHIEAETEYCTQLKAESLKRLSGRCQWFGFMPDEDLPVGYGAMDLVVYPSRYATESGALLTAISHGKAVIASNLEPFKEKEREGALMTFEDVDDLVEKIELLTTNEDERKKLEAGARGYAERNSWENVAKKHISLYEHAIGQWGLKERNVHHQTPQTGAV